MTILEVKKIIWVFLFFLLNTGVFSQTLFLSSSWDGSLYELDIQTCSYTQIAGSTFPNGIPNDITFHPNGNFYYLTNDGILKEYDYQNSSFTVIYDFGLLQNWNSLVTDGNGVFYATGSSGILWTYDLNSGIASFIGNIETPISWISPTGDLTFYKGDLYVAGNSLGGIDVIVKVNIAIPENSETIIESQLNNDIWGIVSHAEYCDCQNVYVVTGGDSEIYLIDFDNQELTLVCQLDFSVGGGATSFEYWGSFPISIQTIETIDAGCNTNNGSIIIAATGGVGQLSYSIDGLLFQASNEFNNLAAGTYTLTIKDENDCPILDTIEIAEGSLQISDISSTVDVCGNGTGSITINANGGTGQLEYSINGVDFQTNNVFNNLSAGNYTVIIQDGNNCSDTEVVTIDIAEAPQIVDIEVVEETCGNSNGSITILANGGTGQLEYSIDSMPFQTSNVFNNLSANIYELIVQDENNCTDTTIVEVEAANAPEISNITSTDEICGNGNGSITISANGGIGQLTYSINGVDFQTNNIFNNLSAGVFTVLVQDSNGCSDSEIINIEGTGNPSIISSLSFPITCNNDFGSIEVEGGGGTPPYEFSIDGLNFQLMDFFDGLDEGIHTIFIQDSLTCLDSAMIEVVAEEPPIIIDVDIFDTTCGEENGALQIETQGGNSIQFSINEIDYQDGNSFADLSAGNYLISLQDANDCTDTQAVIIESSEQPAIQTIETVSASCGEANGSALIFANGFGVDLNYSLNGSDFQNGNEFNDLQEGSYSIYVQDGNGCLASDGFVLSGSPPLIINNLTITSPNCGENNGSLIIEFGSGTGTIQVALNNNDFQAIQSFNNLGAGDYLVNAIDEVGCEIDTMLTLINEDCPLYIPNAFSPNDDGINDLFLIFPHRDFKMTFYTFRVFDRWGALVFEARDFNPNNTGWDGSHKGKRLNPGVYTYFVEVEFESGRKIYNGGITLLR